MFCWVPDCRKHGHYPVVIDGRTEALCLKHQDVLERLYGDRLDNQPSKAATRLRGPSGDSAK